MNEISDINYIKRNWRKGYKHDALGYYPDHSGRCLLCGKRWLVVKGMLKKNCNCTYATPYPKKIKKRVKK